MRNGYVPSSSGGMGFMSADHSGANADGIAIYGHDGISLYTAQTERLRVAQMDWWALEPLLHKLHHQRDYQ